MLFAQSVDIHTKSSCKCSALRTHTHTSAPCCRTVSWGGQFYDRANMLLKRAHHVRYRILRLAFLMAYFLCVCRPLGFVLHIIFGIVFWVWVLINARQARARICLRLRCAHTSYSLRSACCCWLFFSLRSRLCIRLPFVHPLLWRFPSKHARFTVPFT